MSAPLHQLPSQRPGWTLSAEKPGLSEGQKPPQRGWSWVLLLLGSWDHLDPAEAGLLQHRNLWDQPRGGSSGWLTPVVFCFRVFCLFVFGFGWVFFFWGGGVCFVFFSYIFY